MKTKIGFLKTVCTLSLCAVAMISATASRAQFLLSDDFNGQVLLPTWTVQRGYASLTQGWVRLQGSTPGSRDAFIMAGVGSQWTDYHLTTKFHADGGGNSWFNSLINFRVQAQYGWQQGTFYTLYIFPPNSAIPPSDSVFLAKTTSTGGVVIPPIYHAQGIMTAGDNTVDILVKGGRYDVTINGVLAASFVDPNPIPTGGIAVGSIWESVTRYDYVRVNADTEGPVITITAPTNTTYLLNQQVTANYSCADNGSGVASCTGSVAIGSLIDTATLGAKTFTVTAVDNANNSRVSTVNYTVTYAIQTLYDVAKGSKSGSTVPLKLKIRDGNGVDLSSANRALTAISVTQVSTGTVLPVQTPGNSNPNNVFRFTDGQYMLNLKTKGYAPGQYLLNFKVENDNVVHSVAFNIQ